MKLSFCIPTLNRPKYVVETLQSICSNKKYSSDFEVCIFNNCSDLDYSELESIISILSDQFNINYKRGSNRLQIDQSMYEAIHTATGKHLFLIGDDDYLTENGIEEIFSLINESDFDLAVFNAIRVSGITTKKSELIGVFDKVFYDFETALLELKEYCTYGNLLLKRELIREEDFRYLFGTSHAYGCFWLTFFRDFEDNIIPKIIIPKTSVVCLRYVEKSYDIIDVTFGHSYLEHKLFLNVIGEKSKKLLSKFELKLYKRVTTIKFFVQLGIGNNDLSRIRDVNWEFYKKNRFKLFTAKILLKIIIFYKKPLKKLLNIKWLHDFIYKR